MADVRQSPAAAIARFWRERKAAVLIAAGVALAASALAWLALYLRPDTWRYYTDETTFRHLARDTEPRLALWEAPAPAAGVFYVPTERAEPALAPDGARMVLTHGAARGNADLFLSRWDGREWSVPEPLRALNSPFNEIGPAFSRDGRYLFFASDRPGGYGGYDIWVSRWDGAEFAWPAPLTVVVNSRFDDLAPEPSAHDDVLYYSSNRPRQPLTKSEEALGGSALRERFKDADFDIYAANRIPEGVTNRAVERALSMLYSLRESALGDTVVMAKLGGTPDTEKAVDRALAWLAQNQETNGWWSIERHGGQAGHDVGATAFALLTFLGRSELPNRAGPYRLVVSNAVNVLVRHMNYLTGDLRGIRPLQNGMYDHAIGSLALAEAYGLTKDETLYLPAQSVIDFLVDAQNREDGGWRYQPRQEADLSVSGWAIMALKSAELSGLRVPKGTFDGIRKWLRTCAGGDNQGLYDYQPGHRMNSMAMLATGYFCSQLMGLSPNTPRAFESVAVIRKKGLTVDDIYYGYYGTLASYQNQGPLWREWRKQLHEGLLAAQAPDGSWTFRGGHAGAMSRVICTSLAALCLQAHYRYTPLYGLGYNPAPNSTARSTLNEDDIPKPPEYRHAKRMATLSSDANDVQVCVSDHGDFLYFASDRAGGFGGFDLYRSRVSGEAPQPPRNLGPAINSEADETDPALRMAGFNLLFASNRQQEKPDRFRIHSAISREVFRRHEDARLPALKWMAGRYKWPLAFLFAALGGFVVSVLWAARSPAARAAGRSEVSP
jgi:hypothetical protein